MEIFESRNLVRRPNIYANPLPDSIVDLMKAKVNRKTQDILVNEMFINFDVSKSLNNYKGQIDIISGRQDPVAFFSYELKQDRPNAKLHWINECGHYPMYEQPSEFYKILYKVLNAK